MSSMNNKQLQLTLFEDGEEGTEPPDIHSGVEVLIDTLSSRFECNSVLGVLDTVRHFADGVCVHFAYDQCRGREGVNMSKQRTGQVQQELSG